MPHLSDPNKSIDPTNSAVHSPLGKTTEYISEYAPQLLFPIARSEKRDELAEQYPDCQLDFIGEDIWNAYEISWLNLNGLPQIAIGEFRFDATSPNIVESKSLKLYLNSFNQSQFESLKDVEQCIAKDLTFATKSTVSVSLSSPQQFDCHQVQSLAGELIDQSEVVIRDYHYNPDLLEGATLNKDKTTKSIKDNTTRHENTETHDWVDETLVSHLLKSNCLITSQPDWASIQISYQGAKINREQLLQYIVAFRSHNEFHEQCVERIYNDIQHYCKPEKLLVYARYTRRGGLDINPWRASYNCSVESVRLARQ
jgi:7-cyano-7-deazaguanine reductase